MKQVFIYFEVSSRHRKELFDALIKRKATPSNGINSLWTIRQDVISLTELGDELLRCIGEGDKLLITEVVDWESCNVIP